MTSELLALIWMVVAVAITIFSDTLGPIVSIFWPFPVIGWFAGIIYGLLSRGFKIGVNLAYITWTKK